MNLTMYARKAVPALITILLFMPLPGYGSFLKKKSAQKDYLAEYIERVEGVKPPRRRRAAFGLRKAPIRTWRATIRPATSMTSS